MPDDDVTRDDWMRLFPQRLGPCRLQRWLGAGGMGTVFLAGMAEDRPYAAVGTPVAVKVLHPGLIRGERDIERFQREALLGAAIAHPSVVRTHEAGVEAVEPLVYHYLIMEYVVGRSLWALMEQFRQVPEPLLRHLAVQMARGLDAIHATGAVHRDLKPSNVLITPEQQVKLMDLGVAYLLDAAGDLTDTGDFVGTFHYAAPEQFGGVEVGPAADLYALGVVLYEAATGVNPFASGSRHVVMRLHLECVPPRAGEMNLGLTPFFEEVLACLLAKDPAHRFSSAHELAQALDQGEASAWWQEREKLLQTEDRKTAARRLNVARSTRLVGRAEELQVLHALHREAQQGHGRVVVVEGEAGVGKTRLMDEFLRELEAGSTATRIQYGSFAPGGARGGHDALREAVVDGLGHARLQEILERWLPAQRQLVPAFVAHLTGTVQPDGTEKLSVQALHTMYCRLAQALATRQTLVWVVEDLHFGSADDRATLASLARVVCGEKLLLVLTSRPGLPAGELADLEGMDVSRRLGLGRLREADVIVLVGEVLHSPLAAERLGKSLASKTDGNPFFVFEVLKTLKESGALQPLPDGSYTLTRDTADFETPSSLKAFMEDRLSGLTESERALVDVASVQGFGFDPDLVSRVLGRHRLEVLQGLARVERRTGLIRASGAWFQFDHHLLQEVTYASLPPSLRSEYHGLLACAYESKLGLGGRAPEAISGDHAVFLAGHFVRGEATARGGPLVLPALDFLASRYRYDECVTLGYLALDALGEGDPSLRCGIRLKLATALEPLGRLPAHREAIEKAFSEAIALGDPGRAAQARYLLGKIIAESDSPSAMFDVLAEARRLAREARDRGLEARIACEIGHKMSDLARWEEALRYYDEFLALARESGSRADEAGALMSRGRVFDSVGRFEEARHEIAQAVGIFRAIGDRGNELIAASNLENNRVELGEFDQALACLEDRLAHARATGNRKDEAWARYHMVGYFADTGQHRRVVVESRECITLFREIGSQFGEVHAGKELGQALLAAGDFVEAGRVLAQYLALSEKRVDAVAETRIRLCLADLALLEGRPDTVSNHLTRLDELCRSAGMAPDEAEVFLLRSDSARAAGDMTSAREMALQAVVSFRNLRARPMLAKSLVTLGRMVFDSGDAEASRGLFKEARDMAAGQPLDEITLLSAAFLALLGEVDPVSVVFTENTTVSGRAEAHVLLARAGAGDDQLKRCRSLLEGMSAHLSDSDLDSFWRNNPVARGLLQEEARPSRPPR